MSKPLLIGLVGGAMLLGLAFLPRISTAAVDAGAGTHYLARAVSMLRPSSGEGEAGYRSCFMKQSLVFTPAGPRLVHEKACEDGR